MTQTDPSTILVYGIPADPPVAAVLAALQEANQPCIFLDQRNLHQATVELTAGPTLEAFVHLPNRSVDLTRIASVYFRPSDPREFPTIAAAGPESDLSRHALAVEDILSSWAELTPALVLNRPSAMGANNSKPFQSAWIESLGFRIPNTLLTTDPAQALAFWRHHGQVIYKSISGIRSIVSRLTPAHLDRLENIASCPTQLQQYIPGTEYRVHVVDTQVFACAIQSDAVDYRYAEHAYAIHSCALPPEIASHCIRLAQSMDLPLAGLDLRRTPQGEWFCFEVNPSPAFSCFEDPVSPAIAHAVARVLASAVPTNGRTTESDPAPRGIQVTK